MSWCGVLWAQTPAKQLPEVTSTEGREFFVAWLPNGDRAPNSPDLRLQLVANTRFSTTIVVEYPNGYTQNYPMASGQSQDIIVDPQIVYWNSSAGEEETVVRKGIRVYSQNGEKFTLYSINQMGASGVYSVDGAHILPVEALGNEYIVQTADGDKTATEFIVMSTKPGPTNVNISLKVKSRGNADQLNFTFTDSKQCYIVRSQYHDPDDMNAEIDLSGSTICADQPIAVWSGNQDGLVPFRDMTPDHAYDQLLPINKWGKSFIVPMTAKNIQMNVVRIAAMQDNTVVNIKRNNNNVANTPVTLNTGDIYTQQMTQSVGNPNPQNVSLYITSDKPVQVYLYSSSSSANNWYDEDGGLHLPGDASMTLIPPLEFLTDTTIFSTYSNTGANLSHQMNIWALTSQIDNILLDGQAISGWKTVPSNTAYSQNTYDLAEGKHIITAPSKSFSGYAYGIDEGQAYMYPIGYDFTPQKDTLFLLDDSRQYSVHHDGAPSEEWKEKYVSETEGGWFLDKIKLNDDTYLLDSIFVCDSTILDFPIKMYNSWYKTIWEIEGSIQGKGYFTPEEQLSENVARPQLEHQFHLLPIEQNQEPFEDFEVRGIVIRKPIFCDLPEDKWERDTFNTIVRVMRQYDDTTWHVMCIGDTIKFFYDSLYNQRDLTLDDVTQKDSTMFIATRSGAVNPNKWQYNIGTGSYAFTRHYTTVNGCDSLSTIKVYVCDSYLEQKDTVVCEKGLDGLGSKYGDFFKKYSQYTPSRWPKADTILYDTLRAVECMSTPEYQEFRTHCPTFNGCDSILELHLVVKTFTYNTTIANICKSRLDEMGGVYIWKEKGSDREIHRFNPDTMKWDSSYIRMEYVKYVNCEDCPEKGCDSVQNVLRLQFVSDDGQEHTFHVCQGDKDRYYNQTNSRFYVDFDSNGKLCNTPYIYKLNVEVTGDVDGVSQVMCRFIDSVTFFVDTVYKDQMTYDTICWDPDASGQTYSWEKHPKFNAIPVTRPGEFTYRDTMKTYKTKCDSICVLKLRVGQPYETPTVAKICDDGSYTWQDTLFYGDNYDGEKPEKSKRVSGSSYSSIRKMKSQYGCDSILTLELTIHPTYLAGSKDTAICANETYNFYGTIYNTADAPWTAGETYKLTIHDQSIHGCDSMVLHVVTVLPAYLNEKEAPDTVCQVLSETPVYYEWEGTDHAEWNDRHPQQLNTAGSFELVDSLTSIHGCDSVIHRSLVVLPTYELPFSRTMSSEDTIHWTYNYLPVIYAGEKAVFDNPDNWLVKTCHSGINTFVDSLTTQPVGTHFCDSVRILNLLIGQTFRDTTYDVTCANCGTYNWVITSPITGKDTIIEINDLPAPYTQRIYYDSLETALGYDSIYIRILTTYPNYNYTDNGEICQGEEYRWTGHMGNDNSVEHRLYYNGQQITEIPTDQHGTVIVTDSMLTDTIFTNPKTGEVRTIHCDSVHVLTLTVYPTYNDRYVELTDPVSMASNDTISHFTDPHVLFVGYSFDFDAAGVTKAELEEQYDSVVYIPAEHAEFHRDSVVNSSQYGCDSVHYIDISICVVKFTQLYDSIADNDTIWQFGGNTLYREHTHPFITGHAFHTYDDGTPVDYTVAEGREVREYLFIDTLRTANGCDSIVHDFLRVFPSYRFEFDTAICANAQYDWRKYTKLNIGHTGFGYVYDSVNYRVGTHTFDSVYVLGLSVVPSGYWQFDTVLCMNDTIKNWHGRTIYYQPGGLRYVEVTYKADEHMCGDIFHIDLQFAPYYGSTLTEYDTICQGDPYPWISPGEVKPHTEALRNEWGEPISSIPTDVPGVYTYYDSLKTVSCGCDSTYTLHLVIQPTYHFYDTTVVICPGDEYQWVVKDKDGNDYTNGKTYSSDVMTHLYDTIAGQTIHGCDSAYYLHVFVDSVYDIYIDTIICGSMGHYEWNGTVYDELIADSKNWFEAREFFDTIWEHTVRGHCDSTLYLHLTIGPTADSIWTDTICLGETYSIYGHEYTTAGLHTFNNTNQWGCNVTYYLHLVTLPPTEVTIVPEPVCINDTRIDNTYTLRYTYAGEFQPISYSVRYDSAALATGFEDQEAIPINDRLTAGTEYELYIPTPLIDAKENYPRPDRYHAQIAFENGVCQSDSLMTFPLELTMSYPNWLLEQRHGDVIAILNEKYNGGYTWTQYQWYEGDSLLVGQTKPYLHIPTGLTPGAFYHVELTRTDETEAFPTCEIQAIANPINNDFAPTMGYLSVTPTCIVKAHPIAYILSRKSGMYRVSTSDGKFVSEGVFQPDVTEINMPDISGLYIVQLWSTDTPEEPYRAIKVLISEQCPNCDTSSF